ncbi:MAG: hypothetical protein DHS20C18_48390 [Saprospiraceae bacterium]|nr:MAG: hypothetical protein DHS20C18_48390 [Saprospiraceae bacterium]
MKNLILLTSLIVFSLSETYSQDIFIVKTDDKIYKFLPNGNLAYIVTIAPLASESLTDIAISPSNKLYGMTTQQGIVEIDWQTGEYETISTNLHFNAKSLVCANENELFYLSSSSLYSYNITLDSISLIAEIGYSTPGDICILKRNIIFPTLYDIKAYNMDTGNLSTLYCFPDVQVHWGISSMYADCDSSIVLLPSFSTALTPDFLKIDLNTGISTLIEGGSTSTFQIWGMATSEEFAGIECESFEFIDLDCDEIVSTTSSTYEQNEITIYPNPVNQFLQVKGCNSLYKVDIYDSKGMLLEKDLEIRNEINISKLNDGIYFLSIACEGVKSLHKIIKH